jgi:hypothetical protein
MPFATYPELEISIMKTIYPDSTSISTYVPLQTTLEDESLEAPRLATTVVNETPSRTPAPVSDGPELSKVDYILSQRNSNPGQGYYFPPGMTTAEDRQHAQGIADNIGNSETFLNEFNAYKSKHRYR